MKTLLQLMVFALVTVGVYRLVIGRSFESDLGTKGFVIAVVVFFAIGTGLRILNNYRKQKKGGDY